jgi:extradiol dioxygenase family protein
LSNRFHLAIEGGKLQSTIPFYIDILGCKLDMSEEGKWQEGKGPERERHSVDMGEVCVPHLGIHLPLDEYLKVKARVESTVGFLDTPYIRFENTDYQQETFFVEDPNYNVIEIKSMVKDK